MKKNETTPSQVDICGDLCEWLALPGDSVKNATFTDFPQAQEAHPSYSFRKGDLVLIRFPFLDKQGIKLRPAMVLAATSEILTVCFMTSQRHRPEPGDVLLRPDPMNGLDHETLIKTTRIATLQRGMALRLIGRISEPDRQEVNRQLMRWLELP